MTQEDQINELADAVFIYYKALMQHKIPFELVVAIISDWHKAYVQDMIDKRRMRPNLPGQN